MAEGVTSSSACLSWVTGRGKGQVRAGEGSPGLCVYGSGYSNSGPQPPECGLRGVDLRPASGRSPQRTAAPEGIPPCPCRASGSPCPCLPSRRSPAPCPV